MLDFSISSVNMAILVSNLFIIFLVLIFRNRKVMFRLGLPLLVGFVILICVRMIFPVELLPISHNVYLPDLLTTLSATLLPVFVPLPVPDSALLTVALDVPYPI